MTMDEVVVQKVSAVIRPIVHEEIREAMKEGLSPSGKEIDLSDLNMRPFPSVGFLRKKQILEFIPICATSWSEGVRKGIFPKPIPAREGLGRVALWRAEDILDLIRRWGVRDKED